MSRSTARSALVVGADRPFGREIVRALEADFFEVFQSVADAEKRLDLLVVNSPCRAAANPLYDMTDDDFSQAFEPLLYELVSAAQYAVPRMTDGGAIIQIASKGHLGTWDGVEIAAATGACVAMVRSMALELGDRAIRVNTIATDFVGEAWDTAEARHDLAATVAWLGSPASRLISGQLILLDEARALRLAPAARR